MGWQLAVGPSAKQGIGSEIDAHINAICAAIPKEAVHDPLMPNVHPDTLAKLTDEERVTLARLHRKLHGDTGNDVELLRGQMAAAKEAALALVRNLPEPSMVTVMMSGGMGFYGKADTSEVITMSVSYSVPKPVPKG